MKIEERSISLWITSDGAVEETMKSHGIERRWHPSEFHRSSIKEAVGRVLLWVYVGMMGRLSDSGRFYTREASGEKREPAGKRILRFLCWAEERYLPMYVHQACSLPTPTYSPAPSPHHTRAHVCCDCCMQQLHRSHSAVHWLHIHSAVSTPVLEPLRMTHWHDAPKYSEQHVLEFLLIVSRVSELCMRNTTRTECTVGSLFIYAYIKRPVGPS